MNHLVTKKYKGYTYHVAKNGDFYIACKKNRGKYIGFGGFLFVEPEEVIERLIISDENKFPLFSRKEMLEDAKNIAAR